MIFNMDEPVIHQSYEQIMAAMGHPGYGADFSFDVIVEHRTHPGRSIEDIIDSMIDSAPIPH